MTSFEFTSLHYIYNENKHGRQRLQCCIMCVTIRKISERY